MLQCCCSYPQVVDGLVDNFVVGGWVVDKWWMVERRTNARARFTQIKNARFTLALQYTKVYKIYAKVNIWCKASELDRGSKSRGNIHYSCFFIHKQGGIFQKWKVFPERKTSGLLTHALPNNTNALSHFIHPTINTQKLTTKNPHKH